MNIKLVVQDNETGKIFDISEIVDTISLTTQMSDQAGKLTFNYQDDDNIKLHEGSPVYLKVDGVGMFYGTIFTRERTAKDSYSITAYDQMYYLKNKDTYVFPTMTASERFEKVCKDKQLKYRVDDKPSYKVPGAIMDNDTMYNMVQDGIDRTLINTGDWYIIRDDFGTLQFASLNRLKTMLFIGDESLLTDYNFKSTIEGDTYNQVKLIKENKETKKREVYIVKDSNNIKKWGLLQYFEKMDEKANAAQIKERANMILQLKNRVVKTLKLECLGDTRVFAGVGIVLGISDLVKEGIPMNKYFMVTSCTHTFKNDYHTMSLEMAVSI